MKKNKGIENSFILEKNEDNKFIKLCAWHFGLSRQGKKRIVQENKIYTDLGYTISHGMCEKCAEKY